MKEKYKQSVLKNPNSRQGYLSLKKEIPLWDSQESFLPRLFRLCSRTFYGISIAAAVLELFCFFFVGLTNHAVSVIGFIWLGFLILGVIMATGRLVLLNVEKKSFCKKRAKTSLNKFIEKSHFLQSLDKDFIMTARDVFGHIYGVDSEIILPSDTADSLRRFGVARDPFGFEVVMGISQRLNTKIRGDQVYKIVKRIYDNASSVEKVIVILSEEFLKGDV